MNALLAANAVLLAGAIVCLLPMRNRWRAAAGVASQVLATGLVLWAAVPVLLGGEALQGKVDWAHPMGSPSVRLDALGAFFLSWSLPLTVLGSVYAVGYLRRYFDSDRHLGVHYALLNMISLSFVLVYSTNHALVFLLGWEVAALAAWLLVIWDYPNASVRFAGFNYLVSTHIGLIFLVAAFMILYTHTGSWDLGSFGHWLRTHRGGQRDLVFVLLLTSFGLKSAFFPFHSWLPRAHAAAPAHVSALMSGVIHKAGLYALVRFILLLGRPDEWMGWFLIGFSLLSAVIGALYTASQRDLKRLLGYSSTENVGIAGLGLGIACLGLAWGQVGLVVTGLAGALMHVLNHAFFKCQLFYAAGAVYQGTHTVDMERLGGLARLMPWTTMAFLVGGVAISALPPLNGFTSEFVIYTGLFSADRSLSVWALAALAFVGAALAFVGAVSALSITRAFGVVFLGSPRDPSVHDVHEVDGWMRWPTLLHGLGVLVLGVAPTLGLAWAAGAVQLASDGLHGVDAASVTAALQVLEARLARLGVLSMVIALAALVLWAAFDGRRRRKPRSQPTWGCGYTAPTARMQYTGSSFSREFNRRFSSVLALRTRQRVPQDYFPRAGHVITHCDDAVERRLFAVIRHGDATASAWSRHLHEDDPRLAFAAGLLALALIAGLVVLTGEALR
jgi:hydrogenase-4 component B